ncbi:MAG: hypothetical protein VR69_13250 [Peptococcaceae bacterium BRH_c4b]|nr:MAG: hypothetical protein VR69_13250 [Peptococcaceae bacterium BRH_c4b]
MRPALNTGSLRRFAGNDFTGCPGSGHKEIQGFDLGSNLSCVKADAVKGYLGLGIKYLFH